MSETVPAALSNTLADLAERVKLASTASKEAERSATAKAMEAGNLLCEAKAATAHGEWTPFLERAGVHERQARRLMQLSRSALTPDTVSDLGGIKASLEWMKERRLPKPQEVLIVETGDDADADPIAVVWPDPAQQGAYHIGKLDLNPATPHAAATIRPVTGGEAAVWTALHHVLDYRFSDMRFTVVPDADLRADLVRDALALKGVLAAA